MIINGTDQLAVYAGDVNTYGESVHTIKINTDAICQLLVRRQVEK